MFRAGNSSVRLNSFPSKVCGCLGNVSVQSRPSLAPVLVQSRASLAKRLKSVKSKLRGFETLVRLLCSRFGRHRTFSFSESRHSAEAVPKTQHQRSSPLRNNLPRRIQDYRYFRIIGISGFSRFQDFHDIKIFVDLRIFYLS